MKHRHDLSAPAPVNNELDDILAVAPARLSPTGPLERRDRRPRPYVRRLLEEPLSQMTPRHCWELYQRLDGEDRREIAPLVKARLARAGSEHWPAWERREIEQHFGITLLPSPGSVGR